MFSIIFHYAFNYKAQPKYFSLSHRAVAHNESLCHHHKEHDLLYKHPLSFIYYDMKILTQVLIYSLIALAGITISFYAPIALPSSILSMVLLFLLLLFKVVRKERIKEISTFLIQVMAIFFVTPVVSMVKSAAEAGDQLIPIVIVSTLAMLITFSVSALSIHITLRIMRRRQA